MTRRTDAVFRCPICRLALDPGDGGAPWSCAAGHRYDAAREGYVNLLVTHQRRRRQPGDSPDMLRHRRAFLDAGHYGALAEKVAAFARPGTTVLDAGCGEGYYTRHWPAERAGLRLLGVDIAKAGVRMAARRALPGARYAVASVYDLPIIDASIDLALSVFAPLPSGEFERVLRPGGLLVTVTPGPDHLAELKDRLFAEPETHPGSGPLERPGASTTLQPTSSARLRYAVDLPTGAAVADLLAMTPYAWYVPEAVATEVRALSGLRTTVDFVVSCYRSPIEEPGYGQ